jgi:Uma2 family endonuclease
MRVEREASFMIPEMIRAAPARVRGNERLLVTLIEYVEGGGLGWVLQDVDLLFVTGQFLRPDLVVVPTAGRAGITDRGVEVPPALVVEVLSPSSHRIDRVLKPRRYLEFGVPAYWVVDPFEGKLRMWDTATGPDAPREEAVRVAWTLEGADAAFELDVAEVIAPL